MQLPYNDVCMRVYFPICLLKCLITPAKPAKKKFHVSKICYVRLHVKADIAHVLSKFQKQIGESLYVSALCYMTYPMAIVYMCHYPLICDRRAVSRGLCGSAVVSVGQTGDLCYNTSGG